MKPTTHHNISFEVARDLIVLTPEFSNGYFAFKSMTTEHTYEIKVVKKIVPYTGRTLVKVWIRGFGGAYMWLGLYFKGRIFLRREVLETKPAKDIAFVLKKLGIGDPTKLEGQLEIYHQGRCLVCGRILKTKEAVRTGIGSTCASKLQLKIKQTG